MKTTQCPSCGAPVSIRAADSLYVICEYCRSTLLRDGESLKNIGKMADLMDDPSRIQIGTEGRYRGVHFAVIGRIQLKYESGFWNEWHILFDDAKSGWLAEAGGEYIVSFLSPVKGEIPAFKSLKPESLLTLNNSTFMVSNLESATCISGQGELPFKLETGYSVDTADLRERGREGRFATIDYSETPPLFFTGEVVKFNNLKLANLKDKASASTVKTEAFNCPKCASPLKIHSNEIERIVCPSCRSFIGVENEKIKLLKDAIKGKKINPSIPLGSVGKIAGIEWEVIGFMKRTTDPTDEDYAWFEYLLFHEIEGFSWLTEYQGHWNFVRTLSKPPPVSRSQPKFSFGGKNYTLFSSGEAKVTYVIGEFYWQVKVGESAKVEDYISPPNMLSREVSGKEVSWSLGQYLDPDELYQSFKLKVLPVPRSVVYANQPNPYSGNQMGLFLSLFVFIALATLIQFYFLATDDSSAFYRYQLRLPPIAGKSTQFTLPEFELKHKARMLRFTHQTDLDNNWAEITATLINKDTGVNQEGTVVVSYYHGYDDGYWSEGSKSATMSFRNVTPGNYYVLIDAEVGAPTIDPRLTRSSTYRPTPDFTPVNHIISISSNPVTWSNYVLALIALCLIPIYSLLRKLAFEGRRWAESDYTPSGVLRSDDDYDDDDE